MKYTQVIITGDYDFNVQGGAVGSIALPMTPRVSPGGSNMALFIQFASLVCIGAMGGDVTTTLDLRLGGVNVMSQITDPNLILNGSILTDTTQNLIPNNSLLTLVIGVLPVNQGSFKIVLSGYIIYL